MKALLFLLILAACGKHEMPAQKDLRDSDGDLIINEYEKDMDKYISGIIPLEEIVTEVEFQSGVSKLISHKFTVSNKIDLQRYTRDLLVKNIASLKSNDYFNEFSLMRLQSDHKIPLTSEGLIRLKLKSTQSNDTPKSIYLVYPDKRILLGSWGPNMEFNILSEDLNAILKSEAYLAITHLTGKIAFFDKTQEESIREKTYRVLFNDGNKTQILYMAKELELDQILKHFHIESYRDISEENLLTTTLRPLSSEWWIRRINNQDIIIVKDTMRSLSEHYLQSFEKTAFSLSRQNGFPNQPGVLKKHSASRLLLKIRGEKKEVLFKTSVKTEYGTHGKERGWECELHYRKASPVIISDISEEDIRAALQLNKLASLSRLNHYFDEEGPFWEMEIITELEEMPLNLQNFHQGQYLQEGLYDKNCTNDSIGEPKVKPNLQVPERSLSLRIEAFVEKI